MDAETVKLRSQANRKRRLRPQTDTRCLKRSGENGGFALVYMDA